MRLFDYSDDFAVIPTPTTLGIKELRDVYDRDNSKDKKTAWLELTGCYFAGSMGSDNPYRAYKGDERIERINNDIFTGETKFTPSKDQLLNKAILKIVELEDSSLFKMYLRTSIKNIHKLKMFLDGVELNERDDNKKLIHDTKKYADNIRVVAQLTSDLRSLERQVELEEDNQGSKIRGGGDDEYNI